jgi:hypothetical protein
LDSRRRLDGASYFEDLQEAARILGHQLIYCATSDDLIQNQLDYAICADPEYPKLTSIPTFGNIDNIRSFFWEEKRYFNNLLSYDGWLTAADSLTRFLKALAAGFSRSRSIGEFCLSPRICSSVCDLLGKAKNGGLRVCYLGPHHDLTARSLFLSLAQRAYMRFHGPETLWRYLDGKAYYGAAAAESAQSLYAEFGIGLIALPNDLALDDIIDGALFDIVSVGAIAICPDIPWIKKHFGDSVYYYPAWGSYLEIAARIDAIVAEVGDDPGLAAAKARCARRIFETQFSADVWIAKSVRYFEAWLDERREHRAPLQQKTVDVVMRVGGRSIETVQRAVQSIEDQTVGQIRLILVRYKPIDLEAITSGAWRRIEGVKVLDCMGGNRSATLCAGLRAVRADYFAILDDDDYWLDNHLESLLETLADRPEARAFGFSGMILCDAKAEADQERRRILPLDPPTGSISEILGRFGIHTFLAHKSLLRHIDLEDWGLSTAEDTALIGQLLARADLYFTYRPTAVQVVGQGDQSNFLAHPDRADDLLEAVLRIGPDSERIERVLQVPKTYFWHATGKLMEQSRHDRARVVPRRPPTLPWSNSAIGLHVHECTDKTIIAGNWTRKFLGGSDAVLIDDGGEAFVEVLIEEPWALGFAASVSELMACEPDWIVIELTDLFAPVAVGLLESRTGQFASRTLTLEGLISLELWLRVEGPADTLIVQGWDRPSDLPLRVGRIWAVKDNASIGGQAAAPAPGSHGLSIEDAELKRQEQVRREADLEAYRVDQRKWYMENTPDVVIDNDGGVIPLSDRKDLQTGHVPLDAIQVYVSGGEVVAQRASEIDIVIEPGAAPWTFMFQADLAGRLTEDTQWLVVRTGPVRDAFAMGLLRNDQTMVAQTQTLPNKASNEVWLKVTHPAEISRVVFQHWQAPLNGKVPVTGLYLVNGRTCVSR